jgi:hypothetical protein
MSRSFFPVFLLAFLGTIGLASIKQLVADDSLPDEKSKPRVIRLTLHPATPPTPLLKYQLLPQLLDRKPGNAAIGYDRVGLLLHGESPDDFQAKLVKWLDQPASKIDFTEVEKGLSAYQDVLDELRLAARRNRCDWDLPIYDRNFFALSLPESQVSRKYARLIAMQARLQIAQGKYADAIDSLQMGFALARHTAQCPTVIIGVLSIYLSRSSTSERIWRLMQTHYI